MIKNWSFYLFMAACMCLFIALGTWQIKRLAWKTDLLSHIEAEKNIDATKVHLVLSDLNLPSRSSIRRGSLTGRLDTTKSILWRGQIYNGAPVHYVVAPIYVESAEQEKFIVPVVVGMCPDNCDRMTKKIFTKKMVTGLFKYHKDNMFRAPNNVQKNEWYRMDINDLRGAWGSSVVDGLFYAEAQIDPNIEPITSVTTVPNNHKQYAMFWFSMALLIFGLSVYRFISQRRAGII